jgi:hypothetical protein
VSAVFEALIAKLQPRFVHQRRGLQRVAGSLARHLRTGERLQFRIDLREQRPARHQVRRDREQQEVA